MRLLYFYIMLSKDVLKHVHKIQQKKHRQELGEFLIEGVKGVAEALKNADVKMVFVEETKRNEPEFAEILAQASGRKIEYLFVGRKDIGEIKTTDTFPGVSAIVAMQAVAFEDITNGPILCLDQVNDPGNLGTIIRTADWFGIKNILLSEGSVDPYNEKVVRSTMGSLFRTKIFESEYVAETLEELKEKGYHLYALTLGGKDICELKALRQAQGKHVFVFGSESHGIREEVLELCDGKYTIPGKGGAESLNVGVAVGVVLYGLL